MEITIETAYVTEAPYNFHILVRTREGFLRKNIVAVLRSRTFSLKINKLPIF